MINGNIKGIKRTVKDRIEALEHRKTDASVFLDSSLAQEMGEITKSLGRELCVYLSRSGEIVYVALGEGDRADLAEISLRRSGSRLSGLRCIHTHPGGSGMLSPVDMESLKKLRFDAMCAIGVDAAGTTDVSAAVLDQSEQGVHVFTAQSISAIPQEVWLSAIYEADREIRHLDMSVEESARERVMLIGHEPSSLEELERLTDTAGGETVYKAVQKNTAGIVGKGKVAQLALVVQAKNIQLAVYDDELTVVQQRMLEEELGIRVIDRTALILDIFAMRAATREGKMQVELAQLQYRLSRLKGEGLALSRQGGGIGTRGPGEEKLETDRRHINRRIYELKTQLSQLSQRRGLMRKQRKKQELPQIALVGYTNAGKSTLLQALSGCDVFCEDKLFATLDPLTRRCEIEKNIQVCITDTVGFIKKLPHQLVEAFRSTLEEAVFADLLLHVCDGSSRDLFPQMEAVKEVLGQIGAGDIPNILVVNKIDAAEELPPIKGAVYVSAKTGRGMEELQKRIVEALKDMRSEASVFVPYSRGEVLAYIHAKGKILSTEHLNEGTQVTFSAPKDEVSRICARLKMKKTE